MTLTLLEVFAIVLAGFSAGVVNVIVGSGSLISFPTLLLLGFPPVTANVTNTLGLCAAGISGVHGYRRELVGQSRVLKRLGLASFLGGMVGALLLISLPAESFRAIVPVLIAVAVVLVVAGPSLRRRILSRGRDPLAGASWLVIILVLLTGVYGGYFGAAQGVILLGVLGLLLPLGLQDLNAVKNVLVTLVNVIAAVTFIVVSPSHIDWPAAGLLAIGALCGGAMGAKIARRLNPAVLRGFVVVVGVIAIIALVV